MAKTKNNHRRETQRELELQRERDLDLKREARRQKREANLSRKGVAVPEASANDRLHKGGMDVVEEVESAPPQLTLRKNGTARRSANFAKTNLNKIGIRRALPSVCASGIAKQSKRKGPNRLMKKQLKRMAGKKDGMEF